MNLQIESNSTYKQQPKLNNELNRTQIFQKNLENLTTQTTQQQQQPKKLNKANQSIFETKIKAKANIQDPLHQDLNSLQTPQNLTLSKQQNENDQSMYRPKLYVNNPQKNQHLSYFEISQNGQEQTSQNEFGLAFQNKKKNPYNQVSEDRDNEVFRTPFQEQKYFHKKDQRSNILNNFEEESTIKQSISRLKDTTVIRGSQNFNKQGVECKSLRFLGNLSQVNPIHAQNPKDKSFLQKNSFAKHDNFKLSNNGLKTNIYQNQNSFSSPTFLNNDNTNLIDLQQNENILDVINNCTFEQKQKALQISSDLVEKIAGNQANMDINNISNQYGGINCMNFERIQEQEICEFEPIQFQAYSQNIISQDIQNIIQKQKDQFFKDENICAKTIVERINLFNNVGHMIDDYYYTIDQNEYENSLYLWKINEKSLNQQKGNIYYSKYDQNQLVNKIRFENPIQCVCFVENHSDNFKPMLIIATTQEIQLRTFLPKIDNQNFMFQSKQQYKIDDRQKYDLLQLEQPQFEPIILDLGEEISKILQMKKTGKIYYSSHKNAYNQVYIKELQLPQKHSFWDKLLDPEKGQKQSKFTIQNLLQSSRIGQTAKLLGKNFIPLNKRIQSVKAQDRSNIFVNAIKQIIPNVLNFTIQKKCIIDIQIDEQRNILYSLTSKIKQKQKSHREQDFEDQDIDSSSWFSRNSQGKFEAFSETSVEVYDLGILCNDFYKVCEIDQDRLFNIAQDSRGQYFKKSDRVKYNRIYNQFRIVSVHPVTISQSNDRQLLITVNNGTRFFISFQQQSSQNIPFEGEIEKNELMFDQLQLSRINQKWNVVSINHLPSLDDAISSYIQNPNPFRLLKLDKQNELNLNKLTDKQTFFNGTLPFFDEYLLKPKPAYCNQLNCFIYTEIKQFEQQHQNLHDSDQDQEQLKFLNISILSKNEPTFCYLRKMNLDDVIEQNLLVNETYSTLQIQSIENENANVYINDNEKIIEDEFIIQINTPSVHGFLNGPIDKEINLNTQRMIGGNHALKIHQGWGINNGYQYMPINEMEKQVYDAFDLQTIKILTNKRLLTLVTLRPIDQLVGILESIWVQNGAYDLHQFNDFIMKYSIEEVCCMLVQIISEQNQSKYLSSIKFQKEMQEHQKNYRLLKLNLEHGQGKSYVKQPRQLGNQNFSKSKIGSKIPFQSSIQSKASPFLKTGSNFDRLQRTNTFRSQNKQLSDIDEREQNSLSQLSFVYLNPIQQSVKSQVNTEIDQNCNYKVLSNQNLKVLSIASELFQIYGDSTKQNQEFYIIEKFKDKNFLKETSVNLDLSTLKISSLFTYIQRILRPIWDMNITMNKKQTDIFNQESNTMMLIPAGQKLQNILQLLQKQFLFRQQTIEDQARILGQDININNRNDVGIKHSGVLSEVKFVFNFDSIIRENIEIHQNKILNNLIIFIKRCLDVIEFLKIVSFQNDNDNENNSKVLFNQMLKQIGQQKNGKNLLKEIQLTQYKDLVRYGGCNEFVLQDQKFLNNIFGQLNFQKIDAEKFKVVKVLYENCLQIQIEDEKKLDQQQIFDYQKIYNIKAEQIQQMCPTLFSVNQTQAFIGECIIQHSSLEKDKRKQDEIVQQGIRQLKRAPLDINLETVMPTLCKIGRMNEITDLVMTKIKKLNQSIERKINESFNSSMIMESQKKNENIIPIDSQYEQLFECFELIVGQYRALDDHIFEYNKEKNFNKKTKFIQSILDLKSQEKIYIEMKKHKTKEMKWYDMFYKYFSESEFKNYSNQIKLQLRSEIINTIQVYEEKYLLKFLFEYIIYQPTNNLKYQNLPKLDFESFKEVYNHIIGEMQIRKESIDILINHLCKYQSQDNLIQNYENELYVKEELSEMLCNFLEKLLNGKIKIFSIQQDNLESYLTCENKIKYCQLAIDSIEQVEKESNRQQIFAQYHQQMNQFLETFFFEKKVLNALLAKYEKIIQYQNRLDQNSEPYRILDQKKFELRKLQNTLEQLNYRKVDLIQQIVVKYELYDIIYEELFQKMKSQQKQIQYVEENQEMQYLEQQIIEWFGKNIEEIVEFTNIKQVQENKKIKPYTWIEVFKEMFKVQNLLSKISLNYPNIHTNILNIILQAYLSDNKSILNLNLSSQDNDFTLLSNYIMKLLENQQFVSNQEYYIVGQMVDLFASRSHSKVFVSDLYREIQKSNNKLLKRYPLGSQELASFEVNRNICQLLAFIFFWTNKQNFDIQRSKTQIQNRGNYQDKSFLSDLNVYISQSKEQKSILEKDVDEIQNIIVNNENVHLMIPKEYLDAINMLINRIQINIQSFKD